MENRTWADAGPVVALEEPPPPDAAVASTPEMRRRAILDRLVREGYRADFFQVVHLVERLFPGAPAPGETADARGERLTIRPDPALVFPASDVRHVRWEEGPKERVSVQVTFMGLYGIASPLPEFFYDGLVARAEETEALRDFLDLFNHRLYTFFYRAWKRVRPELAPGGARDDLHAGRFEALTGLGTPGLPEDLPVPRGLLTAFAGRLIPQVRSADGLRALVQGWLGLPVEVVENLPRWVPIPRREKMGRNGMQLGITTTIGQRVKDAMGKFRLCIGPMGVEEYFSLLPGGSRARALQWLVRAYVPCTLAFDVELRVRTAELPRTKLGAGGGRLGLTACLGRPAEPVLARVVAYERS